MKKPEYTAGVTKIYRKYLDLLQEDPDHYRVEREDIKTLEQLFSRGGFSGSYYHVRNGREMMDLRNARLTVPKDQNRLYEEIRGTILARPLQRGAEGVFEARCGKEAALTVRCGGFEETVYGSTVQEASARPLEKSVVREKLGRTGGSPFFFEDLRIEADDNAFLPVKELNEMRRLALSKLENALTASARRSPDRGDAPERQPQIREAGEAPGALTLKETPGALTLKEGPGVLTPEEAPGALTPGEHTAKTAEGSAERSCELWISVETPEQLDALADVPQAAGFYVPLSMYSDESFLRKKGQRRIRAALPYILRMGDTEQCRERIRESLKHGAEGFLARGPEELALLLEENLQDLAIADAGLYSWNSGAQKFLRNCGIEHDTVPLELNFRELLQRDNSRSEMILYGRYPLMISAQCLKKNLDRCRKADNAGFAGRPEKRSAPEPLLKLRDRTGTEFPVACCCDFCYNIIYNSFPTDLIREKERIMRLGTCAFRLAFTTESGTEAKRITEEYIKVFLNGGEPCQAAGNTTKGHFGRGVG